MNALKDKAVFLSYASQDAEAAKRIADALRAAGVEVWFDAEGGLEHGDEWDAKIRRQIKECVLFLPIISANTQAREEGYFRIEWELAAQRALGIASGVAFILPIVIDDTREPDALVPDRFRAVQWTRLRGGELTPEVKARFLKLWSHRAGALKHEAVSKGQTTDGGGRQVPAKIALPGWKVYAGLAVAVFALVAGAGWWLLRREAPVVSVPPAPPAPVVVAGPSPAPPASEARQLMEKARALYVNRIDTSRDDCALAEDLLKQAQGKEANDAEVWASLSHLHSYVLMRGWDLSNQRREAARVAAQRAVRLDPASFEGRLAEAFLLADTGPESLEKEKLLRALRTERPAEKRLLRALGSVLDRRGDLAEADALSDEAAALPGGDPLSLYNKSLRHWFAGNTGRAEAAMATALEQAPSFTGALIFTAWYAAHLHGDLERARATINRVPAGEMREDRPAFFAYFIELLGRRPDAAIARLQAVPRAWIEDNWYRGPKALLVGDALQAGGRPAAAAIEWRSALQQLEEKLQQAPSNQRVLFLRAMLLAKLGEREPAEIQFKALVERTGVSLTGDAPVPTWLTDMLILLGRHEEAIPQISRALRRERRAVEYTAATLRLDPKFDPVRARPEFARILADAEAIEQGAIASSRPSRDWPKNPELKKAMTLIFGLDSIAQDFALAEDLVKPELAARPNDPEAVTVAAVVAQEHLTRGFDTTQTRRAQAQKLAERAVQLAPDNPDALAALGRCLLYIGAQLPRAEELVRRAIALRPDEPRYHRMLYGILGQLRPGPDTEVFGARMAALFPTNVLVRYDLARGAKDRNDLVAFERELDATLAISPLATALVWKSWVMLYVHGDVAGMRAWLDRVPERLRQGTRFASALSTCAGLSGETGPAIDLLNDLPDTWLTDFDFTGPKALLLGDLHAIAGRKDLARLQYEAALAEIKLEKTRSPTDLRVRRAEFWTLLGLGLRDEAHAVLRILLDAQTGSYRVSMNNSWWSGPIRSCLLLGERDSALALLKEVVAEPAGRLIIRNQFKVDPRMAPFRDDPEIQAILAGPGAAAGQVAAAPVRDWPKDPQLKQALQLINGIEANTEDFSLAEDLAKTVLGRNPMDPEALTVMARVQDAYLYRGFDRSDERQVTARRYAQRAAQLAPNDPEALAALGIFYFSRSADLARARDLLNQAIKLKPDDPFFHRFRDEAMFRDPKFPRDEALASTERTAALFPQDALAHYQLARAYRDLGRLADMERALDRSIAISPIANAVMWKSRLALWVRGDPAEMKTLIDSVPARTQDLERVVFSRWTHAMAAGLPDEGLAAMRGITTTWFEDFDYIGPRQLLAAQLLELQGKRELARLQYEAALAEVNKQKARAPGDAALPSLETWIYHGLGRKEEARVSHRVALEAVPRPYRYNTLNEWWFTPIPASLLLGEKETALQLIREAVAEVSPTGQSRGNLASLARAALRLRFQIDPRMAPFRDDREIQAILAGPSSSAKATEDREAGKK